MAIRFGVHREVGSLLIGGGIGLAAFGAASAFDGPTLVATWAAAAVALAYLSTRVDAAPASALSDARRLLLAACGFLGLAIAHVLVVEAPPAAIAEGVDDLGSSLVAVASCAIAAFACWYFGRDVDRRVATVAGFVGATGFVYLGSVLIIDTIGADAGGEAREIGQSWLSAFWAAAGLGALIVGMVRRSVNVRLGGLALLALVIGKVWTYDLAELEELPRALSFVALGLLLLIVPSPTSGSSRGRRRDRGTGAAGIRIACGSAARAAPSSQNRRISPECSFPRPPSSAAARWAARSPRRSPPPTSPSSSRTSTRSSSTPPLEKARAVTEGQLAAPGQEGEADPGAGRRPPRRGDGAGSPAPPATTSSATSTS